MHLFPVLRAALLLLIVLAAGCSPYQFAGNQLFRFSEQQVVPRALAQDDLGVDCAAAMAFTGPALGFERVGTRVDRLGVMLWMGAALCAEREALDAELAYLRAEFRQDPVATADARFAQKRAHAVAARREFKAWQRFLALYDEPTPERCPRFRDESDELAFLVGVLAGVQATVNAVQSGQSLGIPREIGPRAVKLAACIDGKKWWDLPAAMQAALWQTIPMLAPEQVDEPPLVTIERIAERGKREGVRLGHVVWALVAANSGDDRLTRQVLRDFTDLPPGWQPQPRYRILDVAAGELMLGLSDRLWTRGTGHRTPIGALGRFPDEAPPRPDISDLLD